MKYSFFNETIIFLLCYDIRRIEKEVI